MSARTGLAGVRGNPYPYRDPSNRSYNSANTAAE
jgi:hypothetical protein